MIRTLEMMSAPCFGGQPTTVGPLTRVNFFFGSNGAGKTTISRTLDDISHCPGSRVVWEQGQPELDIRVYNRDYVTRTIRGAAALPGVFLLGEGSVEAQAEIDELVGPQGKIADAAQNLESFTKTLGAEQPPRGRLGEMTKAKEELASQAWRAKTEFPSPLQPAFAGYNASMIRLTTRVIEIAELYPTTSDTEEGLLAEAVSVFDSSATEVSLLAELDSRDPVTLPGEDLLGMRIVGSSNGSLAELIDTLDNSDWVEEGRRYFAQSGTRCPFCQQEAPQDLAVQLQHYFDERFEQQTAALEDFATRYRAVTASFDRALATLEEVEHVAKDALAGARAGLERAVTFNEAELEKKIARPGSAVTFEPLTGHIAAVNAVIAAANQRISQHNERVRTRKAQHGPLVLRCWQYFVRHVLRDQVTAYETRIAGLVKAKTSLEAKIAQTSQELHALRDRLTELQKLVRSSKSVIDDINATLASVGFTNFRLADSPALADGYSLTRSNGVPVDDFLSEGERTFITFLYFYHQLRDTPEDASFARELVAVIDDPISSLDSDILFVVSTLTRDIIDNARTGKGNVRQVLVLTHNTQFHKEATYLPPREKRPERSFFMLNKVVGGTTTLTPHPTNPVVTPYEALWRDVRAAEAGALTNALGLENILRRIVEHYLRTMGGMDDHAIVAKLAPPDRIAGRSLFSWMNGGSHTIPDPLDFSPTGIETATYLRVFEEVFKVSGHHGHYLMMMHRPIEEDSDGEAPESEGGTDAAA